MSLLSSFKLMGTAMSAQSQRLNAVSSNLANANTVASSEDEVYQARKVVFEAKMKNAINNMGQLAERLDVSRVVQSEAPAKKIYNPSHPQANEEGYIFLPNVDQSEEVVDMIASANSYKAAAQVMETTKKLALKTINLG